MIRRTRFARLAPVGDGFPASSLLSGRSDAWHASLCVSSPWRFATTRLAPLLRSHRGRCAPPRGPGVWSSGPHPDVCRWTCQVLPSSREVPVPVRRDLSPRRARHARPLMACRRRPPVREGDGHPELGISRINTQPTVLLCTPRDAGRPCRHATLASGRWPGSTVWGSHPPDLSGKFPTSLPYVIFPFPRALLGAIPASPFIEGARTPPQRRDRPHYRRWH